ncbi:DUF6327 family protein [Winogradskyella helgolandensis]|uniref:DUF6327 family protein n=1 Tax=Winogradskyella helgolandensis TaxID=2697010 RepID=UPI0015B87982|nr:DUF6327 family protein [Winogradskyella helgolandensis]
MIPNKYNSFADIDNQLKILSLQKQIYKEQIKQSFKSSKNSLRPNNIKHEFKGLLQERLVMILRTYLLKKLKGNRVEEPE